MGVLTIVLIGIGLSADSFAVCVSNGLCYAGFKKFQILKTAVVFSLFQAGMPLVGFVLGHSFAGHIGSIDHWVAFALLGAAGIHMIIEAVKDFKSKKSSPSQRVCTNKNIVYQAFATSIDAFAVGIGFAVIRVDIVFAVITIGIITFFASLFGLWIGKKLSNVMKGPAEIIGGVILLGIGIKILLEGLL